MSQFHPDEPSVPNLPPHDGQGSGPPVQPLRRERPIPRYHVILHQDPTLDLMFVVRSVMELTHFPRAEATIKMWLAHHNGRSVLLTTHLKRAELYVEQFAGKGMTTSVERA